MSDHGRAERRLTGDLERIARETPYVRALARAICAERAEDVEQQAWLQVCEHGGEGVARPRAWLRRIVENVARNLARGDARRRRREQLRGSDAAVPSSFELMQREERRRAIVALVDALPGDQREVTVLRYFEGLPPREIARRLDLPEATVWNLHRRAIERLRRLTEDAASRRHTPIERGAWLAPMLGAGFGPAPPTAARSLATSAAAAITAISMTMKTKITAAIVAACAVFAAITWWPAASAPERPREQAANRPAVAARAIDAPVNAGSPSPEPDGAVPPIREAVPATAANDGEANGGLIVHVFFGGEPPEPAPAVTVLLRREGDDNAVTQRLRTDSDGLATIAGLAPGRWTVRGDRGAPTERVQLVAGEAAEVDLVLPVGQTVRGIVLDPDGRPVAGAGIDVALLGRRDEWPERLATSGPEGKFEIRGAPKPSLLCARAPGYRASDLLFAWNRSGTDVDVVLHLRSGGATVDGVVVDHTGGAIEGALVCVGKGEVRGVVSNPAQPKPALPALVRTDELGRFRAVGVEEGTVPIWVRAPEMAPWQGECVVAEYGTSKLQIRMVAGGVLRGRVLTEKRIPAHGADVHCGIARTVHHMVAHTDADGRYELRGLPVGEVEVRTVHSQLGQSRAMVTLTSGAPTQHDVVLSTGSVLKGSVRDADGAALANVHVSAVAEAEGGATSWQSWARSRFDGTFAIPNCPAGRLLTVRFSRKDLEPVTRAGVDAAGRSLDVRLELVGADAVIRGRVVGPDGRGLGGVEIAPIVSDRKQHIEKKQQTAADGTFTFDGLPTGTWQVSIRSSDHPVPDAPERQLRAGEVWDLGTIQLDVGGTAVLRSTSTAIEDLRFELVDPMTDRRWSFQHTGGEPVSPVLQPGTYRLLIWGPSAAAMSMPLTIVAGTRVEVPVAPDAGVPVQFEFVQAPSAARTDGVRLQVFRGDEQLVDAWLQAPRSGAWRHQLALAPGTYLVRARGRLAGERTITVIESPGVVEGLQLR